MYFANPKTILALKQLIFKKVSGIISMDMWQKVCKSVMDWVQHCLAHDGEHFDHVK